MPFGLDLKSLIVGALLVWFVLPWITGMLGRKTAAKQAA
ncbi:hypothetical protein SEA_WHEEHEIM_20 [Streptomyces phage WheeHeim]|uniref:Uncharacterized protein n=1 Tax=Streptomyces phage WheeHeim TaxID=2500797 RepID=A0A411AXV0_9VIRU|nr:hypothetical protein KMD61_gp24 [Streptomyces phage WheeHeim]QAX92928.1 hypothetical protein SEA_WHEEHEIM_20 [Streptomyces phage WheeHeim]UYL87510.1 membrane protein [Streptomyces phage RickRoss]